LALGLVLAFAGLTFGAVDRRVALQSKSTRRSPGAVASLAATT
jgi:hypothetical protein